MTTEVDNPTAALTVTAASSETADGVVCWIDFAIFPLDGKAKYI